MQLCALLFHCPIVRAFSPSCPILILLYPAMLYFVVRRWWLYFVETTAGSRPASAHPSQPKSNQCGGGSQPREGGSSGSVLILPSRNNFRYMRCCWRANRFPGRGPVSDSLITAQSHVQDRHGGGTMLDFQSTSGIIQRAGRD